MRFREKYRPRRFTDLVGADTYLQSLERAVKSRSVNGILFTGENGTGKSTTAAILTARLACSSPAGMDPCGNCYVCECALGLGVESVPLVRFISGGFLTKRYLEETMHSFTFVPHPPAANHVLYIDDVDLAEPSSFRLLIPLINKFPDSAIILTCTNLSLLDPPLIQRLKVVDIGKPTTEQLQSYVRRICEKEDIVISGGPAIGRFVKLSNSNIRSILNGLEILQERGLSLGEAALMNPAVLSNLGFSVGETRFTPLEPM